MYLMNGILATLACIVVPLTACTSLMPRAAPEQLSGKYECYSRGSNGDADSFDVLNFDSPDIMFGGGIIPIYAIADNIGTVERVVAGAPGELGSLLLRKEVRLDNGRTAEYLTYYTIFRDGASRLRLRRSSKAYSDSEVEYPSKPCTVTTLGF